MNPLLERLHSYPFAKLRTLLDGVSVDTAEEPILLTVGEPQAQPPQFVLDVLRNEAGSVNRYPTVQGLLQLREAVAAWLVQRYGIPERLIDAQKNILPLQGSREGLFAIAQVVVDSQKNIKPLVVMPSPFYQIYEGAAILAGAEPLYIPCDSSSGFSMNLEQVSEQQWARCQIVYLCSPSNPTGYVASHEDYIELLGLADRFDFVIVSDECYSEIYCDETQPCVGLLEVCRALGRDDFSRCLVFNSLSKRSNLAGMRSGFVAGDAELIKAFLQYRTYHGSAMPTHHQFASAVAWQDENHVIKNRAMYRENFEAVLPILQQQFQVSQPEGGFCLWLPTPIDDTAFAKALYQQQAVMVLPGSFLARDVQVGGVDVNPGSGYVRLALVHSAEVCTEAAQRICSFVDSLSA